jgi:hypothetical protein
MKNIAKKLLDFFSKPSTAFTLIFIFLLGYFLSEGFITGFANNFLAFGPTKDSTGEPTKFIGIYLKTWTDVSLAYIIIFISTLFQTYYGWVVNDNISSYVWNPAVNAIPYNKFWTYLILTIDDFNQNHLNSGLISITELSKTLKLPSYYSADMPYTCVYPNKLSSNEQVIINKYNKTYSSYPQVLPSAPRTLTQTQIYTINEIIKNNDSTTNYFAKAPTTTDVFAVIPVKGQIVLGSFYTDYGGSLQNFKRIYFGPVDIDRLRITLQDDKGNIINLNGCDWSITLITENNAVVVEAK